MVQDVCSHLGHLAQRDISFLAFLCLMCYIHCRASLHGARFQAVREPHSAVCMHDVQEAFPMGASA